jgi:hypothetical protein
MDTMKNGIVTPKIRAERNLGYLKGLRAYWVSCGYDTKELDRNIDLLEQDIMNASVEPSDYERKRVQYLDTGEQVHRWTRARKK